MATSLIVNPRASRVHDALIDSVAAALGGATVARTEGPGHATELAREAQAWADAIYVFSGDGGFNEVLNGLDGSVPVGFVPGGGTSVLPRALGLPRDPLAAAQRLAVATPRRISLGRANGRRFAFGAGVGLDADAVRRMNARGRRPDGRRPGDAFFTWTMARLLVEGTYAAPLLEVEGEPACFALAANLAPYSYLGRVPLRVHPHASAEAGIDLIAPQRFRLRSLPRLAAYVLRGTGQERAADIVHLHDRDRIEIRCLRPLPLQVDGEDIGDVESVLLEVERDAVTVLV